MVVDGIVVRPDLATRLAESFETALELADGIAEIEWAEPPTEGPGHLTFSSRFACPVSGFTISEIEPRLFSFNNPFGACPVCGGIGSQMTVDPERVVPDPKLSLKRGAIAPWAKSSSPYYLQTLDALARHYKFKLETRWEALSQNIRDVILFGSGKEDDPVRLRRRLARLWRHQAFRRRGAQPRSPLQGDRERVGPGGDWRATWARRRARPAAAHG